jgi:hypothetical protein
MHLNRADDAQQPSPEAEARQTVGGAGSGIASPRRLHSDRMRSAVVSHRERVATHEAGHCMAAITYGVPVISVTVEDRPHMHRGQYHAPTPELGFEAVAVICFAGICAAEMLCGPITDDGDLPDLRMVREHITRSVSNPLQVGVELARHRDAAARLVRSEFARDRIRVLAAALLARGTLTGEEISAFC